MRRTLAVLALLATTWPHAVVLECALGSTPSSERTGQHPAAHAGAEGSAHHGAAHHGAGHEHRSDGSAGSAPAGGSQCAMLMACVTAMIRSVSGTAVMEAGSAPQDGFPPSLDAPAAADLAADPPPPRRSA
jgi:hypothetical protein